MKAAPTRRISRDIFSLQGSRSTGVVHMGHGSTAKIHPSTSCCYVDVELAEDAR